MLRGMSPEMKVKLGLGLAKDYSYLTLVGRYARRHIFRRQNVNFPVGVNSDLLETHFPAFSGELHGV